MKYLAILILCIPVLGLANETESMSLDEELVSEQREMVEDKIAQLRRMQEITQATQVAEAVQERIESGPGFLEKTYGIGFMVCGIFAAVGWLFIAIKSMWESIRVNYHHYIEYGEFVLFPTSDSDIKRQMKEIAKRFDYSIMQDGTMTEFTWVGCLGFLLVGAIFFALLVFVWPLSVILFGPDIVVETVASRKRKKKIFEKKLQGKNVGTV